MADATWKESISLEETNKIRVSLGLKPISSEPSAAKLKEDAAADNFAAHRDDQRQAREAAALKDRIDKARNQKERQRRLIGIGLGDENPVAGAVKAEDDDGGADSRAWVKRQKKRQKELAAKRIKEEEENEKLMAQVANYGEQDLSGLKVLHGQDDFEEGEETILTLKDNRILDDEDDELHNINLSENTKTAEALALKKKGNQAGQYTGYDDDEFTDKGKAGVLAKYDDDITGADDGGFRLGAAPPPPTKGKGKGKGRAQAEDDEPEREKIQLSMDYAKGFHNDYLQEGEVGFKIKKKKKRAPARVTEASTEAHQEGMDLDGGAGGAIERQNLDETNLIDDDDLQASLARARREQNRKKVLELKANAAKAGSSSNGAGMEVDQVKTEHSPDDELYPSGSRTGGDDDVLVMDDTSEFVRNIQLAAARPTAAPTNGVKRNASPVPLPAHRGVLSALQSGHHSIQPRIKAEEVDVPISEMTAEFGSPREEGEYEEDATMGDGYGDLPGADDDEAEAQVKPKVDPDELGTTAGEKLVSGGMAATLGLLRNQGLIKERTAEEIVRDRTQKEREAWLAEQRNRERQREEERLASRAAGSAISQEQREYENRMREQRDAQIALEAFKDYKPNVNITYHDEFGRNQTMKEAYKQLSHTFHGKGSGAKKTEKRLKKIEEERKQAAMVSGDTPLSSASAFAARAERMGSATMVLSVGNRGTAPVQDEILNNLKKPDLKGKGKAKPIAATALPGRAGVIDDIPLRPLPLPEAGDVGRGASPATASAGFAPVRSFTPIGQEGGDRAAVETGKRGFTSGGFVPIAVKRKAEEELSR